MTWTFYKKFEAERSRQASKAGPAQGRVLHILKGLVFSFQNHRKKRQPGKYFSFQAKWSLSSSLSYHQTPAFRHIHSWFSHTNAFFGWEHSCPRLHSHLDALAKHSLVGFSKQFPTRVAQGWSFFHLLWKQLLLAIISDMIWKYIDPSLIHDEYARRNIKIVGMHLCTIMYKKICIKLACNAHTYKRLNCPRWERAI